MYWEDLIRTWMHDPPDKALGIRGHESRANRYLTAVLSEEGLDVSIKGGTPDIIASMLERLPMPHHRGGELAVGPIDGEITVLHPLSGKVVHLRGCQIDERLVAQSVKKLTGDLGDRKHQFLALWRFLPVALSEEAPYFQYLPADTRIPDHSIWNHLDVASALSYAGTDVGGMAVLSFCIGGAQDFIEGARTLRDLWSGSAIFSWLCFKAMEPIIETYGPTSVVYPALRANPLMDLWLYRIPPLNKLFQKKPEVKTLALPNRFLALVPAGREGETADSLAKQCEEAAQQAWMALSRRVHEALHQKIKGADGWDKLWDDQVKECLEFRTAVLPRNVENWGRDIPGLLGNEETASVFPDTEKIRRLARIIKKDDDVWTAKNPSPQSGKPYTTGKGMIGEWQVLSALSAKLMEAQRTVGHFPAYSPQGEVPQKCTLLGTFEQMGPANLSESADFWNDAKSKVSLSGVRLRSGDRLSAPALVKRFAVPVMLQSELGLQDSFKTPDTATLAAGIWISETDLKDIVDGFEESGEKGVWSGQWLHWSKPDQDKD